MYWLWNLELIQNTEKFYCDGNIKHNSMPIKAKMRKRERERERERERVII